MVSSKVDTSALDSRKIFHPELLKGQVALITGGSNGGMIKQIAKNFLVHGCKAVALMSRKADKLQAVCTELDALTSTGTCFAVPGDVRDYDSCEKTVQAVVQRFGKVDILVNGAAGNFLASAEKLKTKGFKTVTDIDTVGTFNMSKAVFVNSMKERRSGNIINITAQLHWNGSAL